MKMMLAALLLTCLYLPLQSHAQKETTTLILLRHAEKDTGSNPGLTYPGKYRASRLAGLFPNAKPDEFYSTPYKRTFETLEPWAKATGKTIQTYSPQNLQEFANTLKAKKGKTIVVAGHSNTTPALANLLLSDEKYTDLADDEFNKVFVITLVKGKAKCTVVTMPPQ